MGTCQICLPNSLSAPVSYKLYSRGAFPRKNQVTFFNRIHYENNIGNALSFFISSPWKTTSKGLFWHAFPKWNVRTCIREALNSTAKAEMHGMSVFGSFSKIAKAFTPSPAMSIIPIVEKQRLSMERTKMNTLKVPAGCLPSL